MEKARLLHEKFPEQGYSCIATRNDRQFLQILCDFFLWRFVKSKFVISKLKKHTILQLHTEIKLVIGHLRAKIWKKLFIILTLFE